jgi:hypothetical protein
MEKYQPQAQALRLCGVEMYTPNDANASKLCSTAKSFVESRQHSEGLDCCVSTMHKCMLK